MLSMHIATYIQSVEVGKGSRAMVMGGGGHNMHREIRRDGEMMITMMRITKIVMTRMPQILEVLLEAKASVNRQAH